ncbi:MAG: hydrogen peroxide-inducible genes activator [Bacteroides sp.]|nr:hydrogen peroxide-inducible genes activator [Bacteroides sp.]
MTLQQLEYIIAVDQLRHFGRAAEQCRVTQPTLSAMIQKLEEELDTKIFDRNQQPITPTPVGTHIIAQAREVLAQAARIRNIIQEEKHSMTGIFRLGILPTIAPYLLPRFFPQLMKKYKGLDIRVREMKTAEIKEALLTGDIDAGILAQIDGLEPYNQVHLFYEQYFAYVAREDELFRKELIRTSDLAASRDLWLLDEGHCFRDQLLRFCQLKGAQSSQLAYSLGSMETFMRMVESGKGITFIPELAVRQLSQSQQELVRPFAIPTPTRQLILITGKNFVRHTLLENLVREIQSAVPKEMLKLKGTQGLV